jgi:uncharacterized protein
MSPVPSIGRGEPRKLCGSERMHVQARGRRLAAPFGLFAYSSAPAMRESVLCLVILFCLSLGPATSANAQSWCRNAARPDEKLICKDAHLSGLDAELNGAFRRVHRELSGPAKSRLDRDEFGWLLSRHRCGADYGCIERSYVERIEALNGSAARWAPEMSKPAGEIPPPRIEQSRHGAGDRHPPLRWSGAENRGNAPEVLNRPSAGNPAWVNPEPGP